MNMCEPDYKIDFVTWTDGSRVMIRNRVRAGDVVNGLKLVEEFK